MIRRNLVRALDSMRSRPYETLNTATIYRDNLLSNVALFSRLNPDKKLFAVLKSNAYGHGLTEIATILNGADIAMIAVDGYFEANHIIGKTKHRILVMGYIAPANIRLLDNRHCSFVLQDINSVRAFGLSGRTFKVHLEINSGMNRLGLNGPEIDEYLDELMKFPNLTLEGVMTHLADADNPNDDYTNNQIKLFDRVLAKLKRRGLEPVFVHAAQTAGSTKDTSRYTNAIRLGIGLYGINPLDETDRNYHELEGLKPVLGLTSTIIKVLDLKRGEKISYNGTYTTVRPTRIGVLPIGYYEWVPRELSNLGFASAQGHILPIRGRVCMNHTMIDLSNTNLNVGTKVTLISADPAAINSIKNIAKNNKLFSYNLLTRLAESVRREIS